jgi:hypothetical protein
MLTRAPNNEEQVNLINLVKEHTEKFEDIPVIILCNEVDNPNSAEVMGLVSEARQEVERIFAVDDRKEALEQALKGVCATGGGKQARVSYQCPQRTLSCSDLSAECHWATTNISTRHISRRLVIRNAGRTCGPSCQQDRNMLMSSRWSMIPKSIRPGLKSPTLTRS